MKSSLSVRRIFLFHLPLRQLTVTSFPVLSFVPIFYFPVPFACSPHLVPRFSNILASLQSYNPITEILVIYACRSLALNTPVNRPISIYLNSNLAKKCGEIKQKNLCIIHYGDSGRFLLLYTGPKPSMNFNTEDIEIGLLQQMNSPSW